jgi:hypothetical protein
MKIRLHQHPFAAAAPQEFEHASLAHWLLEHYGDTPKVGVQIFEGEPSGETDISSDAAAILRSDAPVYVVLESPGDPVSILINIAISIALNVVMSLLFSESAPRNGNRTQESPNNALSSRENRVRALERVEDIYGTVRSIPSLLMPTYNKYIGHEKVEYGYYCVGRGYHDIEDVRDGDTLISEIDGASAAVYAPFTSPNSGAVQLQIGSAIIDDILTVQRSGSVDGITLPAANQINLSAGMPYSLYAAGTADGAVTAGLVDAIYQGEADRKPNFSAVSEIAQTLTISMTPVNLVRVMTAATAVAGTNTYVADAGYFLGVVVGSTVNVGGFGDPANVGPKTVIAATANTLTVAEALVNEGPIGGGVTFTVDVDYSGTRTIAAVENGFVRLTDALFSPAELALAVTATITVNNGDTDWSAWFTLPDTDRTEVWTNVLAQNGMYKDDGAKSAAAVAYEMQIEQLTALLVPTGVVETVTGSLSGATTNERAETLERATAWTGPARARMRRTTPFDYDFGGAVVDEIKWVDLYSVSPVTTPHFGNKTTIHTITQATSRATSVRRRELNCLASRLLPIYNGATFSGAFDADGRLASGTIAATSKVVDIIAAVAVDPKIGNRAITDVDMAQLWATQQTLDAWNAEAGQFNYTFDSDALSFEETVTTIANAAFCVAYRQNGQIRLALDRPQASSTALFTHRNKKPNSEGITRKFASDAEYDGIEFVYRDPDTESNETIRLPLDGSYTKLKKFELSGIRSYAQAWLRANREYRKLIGQRLSIETETTTDARALLPNSRVDIVDNTRFKSYDGEVVAQSGLTLTLSRDVAFLPATPHSIVLMKRDGSLQSITCTEGTQANQVVLAALPAEALVTTPTADDGVRTIFSFAADSARGAQAWLVQEIGTSDGQYIRLRAVNYSDDYYAADEAAIPAKESVIY